jgi:rhodanese-related sulfurtransferase
VTSAITARDLRLAFVARREVALLDVREERAFARGHPLFASQILPDRIEVESPVRLPRKATLIVVYDDGEGRAQAAYDRLAALGYSNVHVLARGLTGWREEGFELFEDVNSYSKAFGELVEARRHTPSLSAGEVHALLESRADVAILDARRFDEYQTMSIPSATSVPGAELVLHAQTLAPDAKTTIVVNCAGRTRSIIGAQSLINAGIPNPVVALRNGTIGWRLAGQSLETGQARRAPAVSTEAVQVARHRARAVSYRAGVLRVRSRDLADLRALDERALYCFDVRSPEEYAAGHPRGFRHAPGGQLVQEIDVFAPVRGARVVLHDDIGARADMTASWLAQMGWDVYVHDGPFEGSVDPDADTALPPRPTAGRYRRPYEGIDHAEDAMRAYLEWEYGLVDQLSRDGTHGFFVI